MAKRLLTIIALVMAGLVAALAIGCGEDKPKVDVESAADALDQASSQAEDDLNKRIDELKKEEFTVEVLDDGKSVGKWSQDGKGSWRQESSTDSYTIYNAGKKVGWVVSGKTATEITDPAELELYELSNPVTMLAAYASFSMLPRTEGGDDTWEWNVPGMGSLKIEFKGPNKLISKVEVDDPQSGKSVLEFKYTDVGDVPASTFELPSGVTVQESTGSGLSSGFGGSTTVPDTSGLTNTSGYEDLTP